MRVWSLDLSTHTGYSVFDWDPATKVEAGVNPRLVASGTVNLDKAVHDFGPYPHCYRLASSELAAKVWRACEDVSDCYPDVVVIEETNGGRSRYTQKLLENIHTAVLTLLAETLPETQIVYLNSDGHDGWRTNLGLRMSSEQKRVNAKLARASRRARDQGTQLDKKALGIKGKITKKHLALDWVRAHFGLSLKVKDNNEAEAIAIGVAYCNGTKPCDGVK